MRLLCLIQQWVNFMLGRWTSCVSLFVADALQCKVCEENDAKCLFGGQGGDRKCENDEDECYSWFQRHGKRSFCTSDQERRSCFSLGSDIHVRRDCISTTASNYAYIKSLIGQKSSGCVKRLDGMDCFTFCSTDLCNWTKSPQHEKNISSCRTSSPFEINDQSIDARLPFRTRGDQSN